MRVGARRPTGIVRLNQELTKILKMSASSFSQNDGACVGCGGAAALRLASKAINFEAEIAPWKDSKGELRQGGLGVMLTMHTGCMQVIFTTQDTSAVRDNTERGLVRSMMHNSFSDGTPTLIGLHNAYLSRVRQQTVDRPFYFWSFAGDGGATIGMGQISSFLQQGHGLLVVYDNRGYMNTGAQVSATTMPGEDRTTTPHGKVIPGNQFFPRDLIKIATAHDVPFAATASVATPALALDFMHKVRYAINIDGPSLVWVDAPCPKEQGYNADQSLNVAMSMVNTGLWPIVRYQQGQWSIDMLRSQERTGKAVKVEDFFDRQAKSSKMNNDQLALLTEQTETRYEWLLKRAGYEPSRGRPTVKLKEGITPPSLYLPEGLSEQDKIKLLTRELHEF
jgi:pyruvate/2-oxoacid:ferredoxin oxidoreductase beta subunit